MAYVKIVWLSCCLWVFAQASASELVNRKLPEEYETVGGHSLGFGNAGVAAGGGISAVRLNPSLIAMEKTYSLDAGYNWPTQGREFFQAGIVDTKSSHIGAGVLYSGFMEKHEDFTFTEENDSTVNRRLAVALAGTMKNLALGLNGQYVEAETFESLEGSKVVKGTTLGFGVSGLITPQLRFGLSAENMANKKVADYAPRIYRGGLAFIFAGAPVTLHLDYRQRDRVDQFEQGAESGVVGDAYSIAEQEEIAKENDEYNAPERMVIGSFSARVYDMLRILGGYGRNIAGPERQTLSGGLALVSGSMSLSYTASRPYLSDEEAHQAINASLGVQF